MRRMFLTALGFLWCGVAAAQVPEIRFAQQFSMGYLQFTVMKHLDLLPKHAAALGIPEVKIAFITFNGPDNMNDALLSGAVDIASGGVPGMLTIWAKTHGTPLEVRGVSAMSRNPAILVSRDPRIRTIRDYQPNDRITVPAVKVSVQAALLEMAAAKEWGDAAWERLDANAFSLSPPDATAGILSGNKEFTSAFTVPPFQNMMLKDPAVHVVLNSDDLLGQGATGAVAWTTKRFHDANPKLYQAMLNAMEEASTYIAGHPHETTMFYAEDSKGKIDVELMESLLRDPAYRYVLEPRGTMKWAEFMHKIGRIKVKANSWKDLFWPELHDRDGS